MNIETIIVGPFEVNCYVICGDDNTAVIIDPGADADRILTHLHRPVAAYLLTHGHADHAGALADLARKHPAPVYIHEADERWAFSPRNQIPPHYDVPLRPVATFHFVKDGEVFTVAGLRFRVLETPGHTPGGVCFWIPDANVLFSGDTLFNGSVGRTDLPGGSGRMLSQSLRKIAALPDVTRVYPGHGPTTTIGLEKKQNVYLRNNSSP